MMDVLIKFIVFSGVVVTLPGTIYLLVISIAGYFNQFKITKDLECKIIKHMKFGIIVPAHNESENVLVALNSISNCVAPKAGYEIIVIADNCSDNTAEIVEQHGYRVLRRNNDKFRGKGYALDYAFKELESENHDVYLIMDADTICEKNLLIEFEKRFLKGEDVLQAPYLVEDKTQDNTYARIVNIGFRAFNFLRPSGREALGFSVGILGTGFALTKSVIKKVPYSAGSIVEDLEYHLALVRAGYRCRFVKETCVYSSMPEMTGDAETQRSRWEGGRIRMILDGCLPLLKDLFHCRFRMVEPLLELLLLPLWMHLILIMTLMIMPLEISRVYALFAFVVVLLHVLMAIIATGGGLKELKVLIIVPKYIAWKLKIITKIFNKSKKDASWDRTGRD